MTSWKRQRGSALVVALGFVAVLGAAAIGIATLAASARRQALLEANRLRAQGIAEAGLAQLQKKIGEGEPVSVSGSFGGGRYLATPRAREGSEVLDAEATGALGDVAVTIDAAIVRSGSIGRVLSWKVR